MCDCAALTREEKLNARASGLAVQHLGDVLYVVASSSKINTTYDVETIGDDWLDWTCDCEATVPGCIHKRAVWLSVQRAARSARRRPRAAVTAESAIPF